MLLPLLLACHCELDGSLPVVGRVLHLCMDGLNARDAAGLAALLLHFATGIIAVWPQLFHNRSLRSGANHSLLCLFFVLAGEACFFIATLLERWAWAWQGFRLWRLLMATVLLVQVLYYKRWARPDFAAAVEAPYAQVVASRSQAAYDEEEGHLAVHPVLGEYEESAADHGFPVRNSAGVLRMGGSSSSVVVNKSGAYGMHSESWGETLLGQPTPVRLTDPFAAQGRAHSPARSRLPSSQQHLLAHDAPRTISPNLSPKITTVRQVAAPGVSSHSVASSPAVDGFSERSRLAALQEAHRAHGRSSPRHQPGSVSPSTVAFQPSPGSAFRPVAQSESSLNSISSFSAVQTTEHTAFQVRATASTNAQPDGGAAPGGIGKLTTIGLGLVMLTMLAAGAHAMGGVSSSADLQATSSPAAGRSLLSTESAAFSLSSSSPFGYDPSICNMPYSPTSGTTYAVRVFSWLGCVFACLALFPQFIYNDSYMKSTRGISFVTVGLIMISNAAWVVSNTLPQHNDFLRNPFAADYDDGEGNYYRDQVILPILISHGFIFLQLWVLVVQRKRFNAPKHRI